MRKCKDCDRPCPVAPGGRLRERCDEHRAKRRRAKMTRYHANWRAKNRLNLKRYDYLRLRRMTPHTSAVEWTGGPKRGR